MRRRDFLKSSSLLAATPLALSLPEAIAAPQPSSAPQALAFPKGFVWGTATASYQVEGAVKEDGRGPSVWDTFSHLPGAIVHNDTGDVADDFYHRYKEDIQLMKRLGVKGFRFSIAWPRVFPEGKGSANPKGLDFYKRLIDELHANGIEPFCTLFHWDLPQPLQDQYAGWRGRETAEAFGEYASYVSKQLNDRIRYWMTINELNSYINLAYSENPIHAPKLKSTPKQLAQTSHYALLGHGLAVQAIRANASKARVGIAQNTNGAMPVVETPEHIAAAKKAIRHFNEAYEVPMLEGKYSERYLSKLGADAPRFTSEEMKTIAQPLDFYGVNIYSTTEVMAADNEDGYIVPKRPASYPHLTADWLYYNPQSLYWTPRLMRDVWGLKEIYITENGCAADDTLTDGRVLDTDRVNLLRNYLTQLQRATAEGIPVRGYFLWSMLDNFEWTMGYSQRFGITYVDYATQKRTPKLSYEFYQAVIASNRLA
ncbi:GH1 family beta-glucosidase [Terriglobus tenax]|uniref:GH1 family beta-glucosidase n=1 Tax=Terriglobus tenax TaxID=1111115 RepID=UPI0021E0603D|nr:GH1 family beta-glucosidase [Terriglobus tenax]